MSEKRAQSGMTLVEILVAMVMMGIVLTGLYNLFRVHNLMAAKQEETTVMQQELLSAVVQIAEDLRMCGYTVTSGTSNGFVEIATNATSVRCTRDPAPDGSTQIAYILRPNNTIDWLNASAEWVTAAENIADLTFVYRDRNGDVIPVNTPEIETDTRFIDITISAAASDERAGLNISNRIMNTRVYCRNMGL
ncbi:MAG: prepilin-type N-terminal cleavage/methylation domain-containing protein [Desulfomicrobium sp.]|nr:prepilin-type N-terminal cleavage/methylation domain-containing protein [Pseudomonadota bacterium]MBV1714113.1 prepilin-type N-terminal cleavage/methylation domain-containing protein [Desulfomicrobium sp.]MBU4571650.1 prepilin-type N-terminal cleavage/methylation domain-containing protein [Pseudomonadota bacterium]MBU4595798.1 prepilin-type N-terminal cleavage/methylation domain-containing protein [Pseudomonadota bacterium]MBV1721716.1 prepilin-type N-terminal cleavage/methylation domain-con